MTDLKTKNAGSSLSQFVICHLSFVIGKACALPSAQLISHREIQLPPNGGRDDAGERKVLYEDSKDCRLNLSRFVSSQFHRLRRRVWRRRPLWWRRGWWGRPLLGRGGLGGGALWRRRGLVGGAFSAPRCRLVVGCTWFYLGYLRLGS